MLWWVIGISFVLWIYGIHSAKKRGVSPMVQVLFSVVMLGGALTDFLFHEGAIPSVRFTAVVSVAICIVVLAVPAVVFLKMRLYVSYVLFASGISLIYFSFLASELYFIPLFAIGLILFFASFLGGLLRGKERPAQDR